MASKKRILIVGGVAGGASCAARIRRVMQASHSIQVKKVLIQTFKGCIKRLKLVGNQQHFY